MNKHQHLIKRLHNALFTMTYKTTNRCNMACKHCCYRCSPRCSAAFIPQKDILQLNDMAIKHPNFAKGVLESGGECMLAYDLVSDKYIPTITQDALDKGITTTIKTNGLWVKGSKRDKIWRDIEKLKFRNDDARLQIHLSVDRYHKDCMYTAAVIIANTCTSKNLANKTELTIASFKRDFDDMVIDGVLKFLQDVGYPLYENDKNGSINILNTPVNLGAPTELQYGRAADNGIGEKEYFDENHIFLKQFLAPVELRNQKVDILPLEFDARGYVAIESLYGFKFQVPYHKNGKIKPIEQIISELAVRAANYFHPNVKHR